MNKNKKFIIWFEDLKIQDVPLVGGKNAALGEMYSGLTPLGVNIPNGFTITASAYWHFLKETGLDKEIKNIIAGLNTKDIKDLQKRGQAVRQAILKAEIPEDLKKLIVENYKKLEKIYHKNVDTAVRSSATAEDLPGASFAGQHETYLNVKGDSEILIAVKKCFASLFKDRAISYRAENGFPALSVALSVGIQKMVRSDISASGVAFTIDTESGFDKVIVIDGIYGLGEFIVQGKVLPDEWVVFKPTMEQGYKSIIAQDLGKKDIKLAYSKKGGTVKVNIDKKKQDQFCLSKKEVLQLADWCLKIEKHFSKKHGKYQAMDIEWAKDGKTEKLFIVQARPETVHSMEDKNIYREYTLKQQGKLLLTGIAVGTKIGEGRVRIIKDTKKMTDFKKGEVLVTEITDPDWEPIMRIASAIVTDKGGRTSHAAIVSREIGIPCIVGSGKATQVLKNGMDVTIDCSSGEVGKIYKGKLAYGTVEHHLNKIPKTKTEIMVNIGSPDEAFKNHFLPTSGVGLGRLEFIIMSHIKIHPNALIDFNKIKNEAKHKPQLNKLVHQIEKITAGYPSKEDFYVDELAEGIAKIGAAFWPDKVIIRFSDFKTNEYSKLIGGDLYEPSEENPMIGWRGASRYYDPKFKSAFGLECKALKRVREEFGLKNVVPMIPFCRTPEEAGQVVEAMKINGLDRKKDKNLKIYVMCEIPSNVLLADKFLDIFDGMSIGSNDLTQLVLGLDRDSGIVTHIANENNEAVKKMIAEIIAKCRARKKYIGICGQAPSDYPEFLDFLIKNKIESISLNPDTVIKNILRVKNKEK
ncbi:MAG: phosphoenolpyruvate synthase [Candidatus Pacebacteria bacterium]|nr:phosphoenolpyruvate synthase [Candidatus Paceibacterota bacterium]